MSDVEDRARDLLADPPIGVETWGPVVEELLAELAKARNVIGQVRAEVDSLPDHLRSPAVRRVIDILADAEGSGQ